MLNHTVTVTSGMGSVIDTPSLFLYFPFSIDKPSKYPKHLINQQYPTVLTPLLPLFLLRFYRMTGHGRRNWTTGMKGIGRNRLHQRSDLEFFRPIPSVTQSYYFFIQPPFSFTVLISSFSPFPWSFICLPVRPYDLFKN